MQSTSDWLPLAPPAQLDARSVVLTRVSPADIPDIVDAVNETLDTLRLWMPWAQTPATTDSIATYVQEATSHWEGFQAFQYVLRDAATSRVAGAAGLHNRMDEGTLEIGYWVCASFQRRGVATQAARRLTEAALALPGVTTVAIRCDRENHASAGVPAKLGYRLDRIAPSECGQTDHTSGEMMVWLADHHTCGNEGHPSSVGHP